MRRAGSQIYNSPAKDAMTPPRPRAAASVLLPLCFMAMFVLVVTLEADRRHIGNRQWVEGCWCWSNSDSRFWPARLNGIMCTMDDAPSLLAWAFTP